MTADVTVKRGDRHATTWTANADLTGATLRLLARPIGRPGTIIELAVTPTNPAQGVVTHELTGTLDEGEYQVELETTHGEEVRTFPSDGYLLLEVLPDLR